MSKTMKEASNFFAFIPQQIEADWHEKYGPLLKRFPLNIVFARIANEAQTGKQVLTNVCYWFAPATYREDSDRREMCYLTKTKNDYFIRVTHEKNTGWWRTEKFKAEKLIRLAEGSTFESAMIHTTMGGPEPDEIGKKDCTTLSR